MQARLTEAEPLHGFGPSVQAARLALGGMLAMAAAVGVGRFVYTPILPPMLEGLGLTESEVGLIASANFLGYLAGAFAAASARLPGSLRSWLLWALAASALTTAAMGLGEGLGLFLALRFAGGAASALVLVLSSALVLERLAGRGGCSAVHFAGVGGGIVVSALVTGQVSAAGGDWRAMWGLGGLVSLAAVIAVALLIPGARGTRRRQEAAISGARPSRLWPLVVAYGLFGFGYVVTATFLVAIVRGSAGSASPGTGSHEMLVWLLVGLAAIPSVSAWTMLGRRLGMLRAFALACLVEAIGVVASVVWTDSAGLLVAAALLGATFMGITALGLIAARALSGDRARRALAVMTAAFGLGQILGPLVAGYGFALTGGFLAPSLLAAVALCLAAVLAAVVARG